jgi:predicted type IV restriction endonuclease
MISEYISRFVNLINRLKEKLVKYKDLFVQNEAAVRYAIVNPFLRMLGWDIEDPEEVIPEYTNPRIEGKADYALFIKEVSNIPIAFIEVKKLGGITGEIVREKLKYSFDSGVRYTIITDGNEWFLYDVFKPNVPFNERVVVSWRILQDDPYEILFKSLTIANIKIFGKEKPYQPILPSTTKMIEAETSKTLATRSESAKLPFTTKNIRRLILQILTESREPMKKKEIVKKIGELVELAPHHLELTPKKKRLRWEARVRWEIWKMKREGLIKTVEKGLYIITEKGRKELEELSK